MDESTLARLLLGPIQERMAKKHFGLVCYGNLAVMSITREAVLAAMEEEEMIKVDCKLGMCALRALDRGDPGECAICLAGFSEEDVKMSDIVTNREFAIYIAPHAEGGDRLYELGEDVGQYWYLGTDGKLHGLFSCGVVSVDTEAEAIEFALWSIQGQHPADVVDRIAFFSVNNFDRQQRVDKEVPVLREDGVYQDLAGKASEPYCKLFIRKAKTSPAKL